jgi:hypothetical protein
MPQAGSAESTHAFYGLEATHLAGGGRKSNPASPWALQREACRAHLGRPTRTPASSSSPALKTKGPGGEVEGMTMPRRIFPPSSIDTHVGNRMRMRRMMLGWSQEKLAEKFRLTFQQVQKYERA